MISSSVGHLLQKCLLLKRHITMTFHIDTRFIMNQSFIRLISQMRLQKLIFMKLVVIQLIGTLDCVHFGALLELGLFN